MKTSLWKLKRSLNNLAFRMSFIRLAPGASVYNADLRDGNPRSLYDVHEHTLCLSSQARLWIPGVRDDHGGNLHCITVRPNLRQDRPTLSYRRRALASNG